MTPPFLGKSPHICPEFQIPTAYLTAPLECLKGIQYIQSRIHSLLSNILFLPNSPPTGKWHKPFSFLKKLDFSLFLTLHYSIHCQVLSFLSQHCISNLFSSLHFNWYHPSPKAYPSLSEYLILPPL
jgi:hypothetical protein